MAKFKTALLKKSKGIISISDIAGTNGYPSSERFSKGPVPVIECVEEIPCNPCETVCNRNLIKVGDPITNCPVLVDSDGGCSGCAKCIVVCPGLAVFVIDKTFSQKEASIAIPYEELPLPIKGDKIYGIDRGGQVVCKGCVHNVLSGQRLNHTNVVTIVVPKEHADRVRYLRRIEA
jgi:Fe-S-cluster-containing hydrogenase component 2